MLKSQTRAIAKKVAIVKQTLLNRTGLTVEATSNLLPRFDVSDAMGNYHVVALEPDFILKSQKGTIVAAIVAEVKSRPSYMKEREIHERCPNCNEYAYLGEEIARDKLQDRHGWRVLLECKCGKEVEIETIMPYLED